MNDEQLKAKLLWRCRRGMKELDVLMVRYVEENYFSADANEKQAFDQLLLMQDPDLYGLITGRVENTNKDITDVVTILTQYYQS